MAPRLDVVSRLPLLQRGARRRRPRIEGGCHLQIICPTRGAAITYRLHERFDLETAPTRISYDKLVVFYLYKPSRLELAHGLTNGFVSGPERLSTCLARYYVEETLLRARREFSNHSQHQVVEIITRGELHFCLAVWLQQPPPLPKASWTRSRLRGRCRRSEVRKKGLSQVRAA